MDDLKTPWSCKFCVGAIKTEEDWKQPINVTEGEDCWTRDFMLSTPAVRFLCTKQKVALHQQVNFTLCRCEFRPGALGLFSFLQTFVSHFQSLFSEASAFDRGTISLSDAEEARDVLA